MLTLLLALILLYSAALMASVTGIPPARRAQPRHPVPPAAKARFSAAPPGPQPWRGSPALSFWSLA